MVPHLPTELADAAWFYIDRAAGSYIGAIKGSNLYVWTALMAPCTVTNTGTATWLVQAGSLPLP